MLEFTSNIKSINICVANFHHKNHLRNTILTLEFTSRLPYITWFTSILFKNVFKLCIYTIFYRLGVYSQPAHRWQNLQMLPKKNGICASIGVITNSNEPTKLTGEWCFYVNQKGSTNIEINPMLYAHNAALEKAMLILPLNMSELHFQCLQNSRQSIWKLIMHQYCKYPLSNLFFPTHLPFSFSHIYFNFHPPLI